MEFQIEPKRIGKSEVDAVSGRELHKRLGSKQDFSTWAKARIKECDALENVDFVKVTTFDSTNLWNQNGANLKNHKSMKNQVAKRGGDRKSVDYVLSVDIAKHFAMLERNAIGRKVRQYFIDFEKAHKRDEIGEIVAIQAKSVANIKLINDNVIAVNAKADAALSLANELKATQRLSFAQEKALQDAVKSKFSEFARMEKTPDSNFKARTFSKLYKILKNRFNVPRYGEIPQRSFNDAMACVRNISLGDLLAN